MDKLELIFSREKETRNTSGIRKYLEKWLTVAIAVGALYVQREALGEPGATAAKGDY